jgi:SHS family lactate transporter-like MFS transporter
MYSRDGTPRRQRNRSLQQPSTGKEAIYPARLARPSGRAVVATPILLSNLATFTAAGIWGWMADNIGRRGTITILALSGCIVAPTYLLTDDMTWIMVGFVIQGSFGGALHVLNPTYLTERFPTEVRSTASGFCYHFGAIFGGLVPPVVSYFAIERHMGFATPMLIGTVGGAASVVTALLLSPETKGKSLVSM